MVFENSSIDLVLSLFFREDHIWNLDLGMMVIFNTQIHISEVDGPIRTPVEAGETIYAMIRPHWFTVHYFNVVLGADFLTSSTPPAIFIGGEEQWINAFKQYSIEEYQINRD